MREVHGDAVQSTTTQAEVEVERSHEAELTESTLPTPHRASSHSGLPSLIHLVAITALESVDMITPG